MSPADTGTALIELGPLAVDTWGQGVALAIGIALLVAGRRLVWLALAAAGLVAGVVIGNQLWTADSVWLTLGLALAGGLVGAWLAVALPRAAVAVLGLVLGVVAGLELATLLGVGGWMSWLVGLVLGLVASLVAARVLELALVVLTAGAGAALLVAATGLDPAAEAALFVGAWIVGSLIQGRRRHRRRERG